jgi:ribose 1,5-bisphosphokinase PhnN
MNPHIYFYIDVKDDADRVTNWAVEGGAPSMLYRNGWRANSLKVGDQVTIDGWLAKDGSNLANMRIATLPDGRTVFGASSGGDTK